MIDPLFYSSWGVGKGKVDLSVFEPPVNEFVFRFDCECGWELDLIFDWFLVKLL